MRHFEVAIGHVVVADERETISSDDHGGVLPNLACIVQGGEGGGGAEPVGTVGYLEVAVTYVVLADQAKGSVPIVTAVYRPTSPALSTVLRVAEVQARLE